MTRAAALVALAVAAPPALASPATGGTTSTHTYHLLPRDASGDLCLLAGSEGTVDSVDGTAQGDASDLCDTDGSVRATLSSSGNAFDIDLASRDYAIFNGSSTTQAFAVGPLSVPRFYDDSTISNVMFTQIQFTVPTFVLTQPRPNVTISHFGVHVLDSTYELRLVRPDGATTSVLQVENGTQLLNSGWGTRVLAPGRYTASMTARLSSIGAGTQSSIRQSTVLGILLENMTEVPPPPAYDTDTSGAFTVADLCQFIANPTDLTGDGLADQDDIDAFAHALDTYLGGYPDADGDGVPDLCDPDCPADLDGNGSVNIDDIDAFATAFLAGDLAADTDGSGGLNLDDVDFFASAFVAGCP